MTIPQKILMTKESFGLHDSPGQTRWLVFRELPAEDQFFMLSRHRHTQLAPYAQRTVPQKPPRSKGWITAPRRSQFEPRCRTKVGCLSAVVSEVGDIVQTRLVGDKLGVGDLNGVDSTNS